jgi:peptidyl-prolyl cis-trans isomerase C
MLNRNKSILFVILMLGILSFGFLGLGSKKKNAIAVVDKEVITKADLNKRLNSYPAQLKDQLQKKEIKVKILDQLIDELLLYNEALDLGYLKNEEYIDQMEQAQKQLLISLLVRDKIDKSITVTDEEIIAYFKNNPEQFKELEQRKAKHILVKSKAQANEISKKLKKGGNFSTLAKKYSIDEATAKNGGDIGWFTTGRLVPEFEKVAFTLKKGQLSGPVKTQFGYHIILLEDVNVRPNLKLEEVKGQIQQIVSTNKKRNVTNDYLKQLRTKHKISRDVSKID